jgi:hypothetical protein
MPIFRAQFRQALGIAGFSTRYKWSNILYGEYADVVTAAENMAAWWSAYLRPGARPQVFCYEVYVTDLDPATTEYQLVSIPAGDQRGTASAGAGDFYEKDICLSVAMNVSTGRPSRKFWRPALREDDFNGFGELDSATLTTAVAGAFSELIAGSAALCDESGHQYVGVGAIKQTIRRLGRQSGFGLPTAPAFG